VEPSTLATLTHLRKHARRTPVLVVNCAPSDPEVRGRALAAGAADLIERAEATLPLLTRSIQHAIEKTRVELELARMSRIVEANLEATLIVDEGGLVRFMNQTAERLLHRSRDEMVGRSVGFPIHDSGLAVIEIVVLGRRREVELRVTPLDWEGERCSLAMIRDVTEQRATRERRRRAGELEAVGRLAGGIAHDFNNLLTGIMTFTSLVRETIDVGDSRRDDLTQVLNAGKRAVELTRQLLAFSRKEPSAPRPVDLNALLAEVAVRMGALVRPGVRIETRLSPKLWPVLLDPAQFEQIMAILVSNADDAMPSGGMLVIETENDEDIVLGNCVLCSVSDEGVGMTEDVQKHIFQPFFTTKAPGRGTGMGLATAYGLLLQANGTVEVRSRPGKGARFDLRFPKATEMPRSLTPAPKRPPLAQGGETILVVEDEPLVRQSVIRMLRRGGYKFVEASTGLEACELFTQRRQEIQLALLDVVMPELSGPETAIRLRAVNPAVKILFMSGYPRDFFDENAEARSLGPLIQKPMTEDVLLAVVRRVLDEQEHESDRL
jgi:hypothetical protein